MLRLGVVVIGVSDAERAAGFYARALGYRRYPLDRVEDGFVVLAPPDGGPLLALDEVGGPPADRPRVHLDLHAPDAEAMHAEVERLVTLGARRVDWDGYPTDPAAHNYDAYVVLADPEGNLFCVVDDTRAP
ncbi:VOC family protein [Micromonospora endolithica]|uniref:VOC family protein n=1 Tax=Micromonospora endolithica TaxID=230091 RepID=A0A3A9ZI80_9ACTN|nr:VOC family protein [Micromonospora endolithica]RKN47849.1 VOC family protein [Micromonospora endolithica]TWJ21542.1 glyoxalase/bleomycin resistance protein/dioxygenase superfamily protein [Micromonospora endolithica]